MSRLFFAFSQRYTPPTRVVIYEGMTFPARWTGWRKPPPKSNVASLALQQARMRSTTHTQDVLPDSAVCLPTLHAIDHLCSIWSCNNGGVLLHSTHYVCVLYVCTSAHLITDECGVLRFMHACMRYAWYMQASVSCPDLPRQITHPFLEKLTVVNNVP